MHEEIKHPCVQHKLALLRDEATGYREFRDLAKEITMFVCYEALKGVNVREVSVQTPLAVAHCHKIDEDLVVGGQQGAHLRVHEVDPQPQGDAR